MRIEAVIRRAIDRATGAESRRLDAQKQEERNRVWGKHIDAMGKMHHEAGVEPYKGEIVPIEVAKVLKARGTIEFR